MVTSSNNHNLNTNSIVQNSRSKRKKAILIVSTVLSIVCIFLFFNFGSTVKESIIKNISTTGETQKIIYYKDSVIVGSRLFNVTCFDNKGDIFWEVSTKGKIVDVLLKDEKVYAASTDRSIYIIDANDGVVQHVIPLDMIPVTLQVFDNDDFVVSVSQSTVKNRLYKIDSQGEIQKRMDISYKALSVAYDNLLLYVASNDGFIRTFDHELNLVQEKRMDFIVADLIINTNGILIGAAEQGSIYYLNNKLEIINQYHVPINNDAKVLSLSINKTTNDYVVGTSYGELFVLDESGQILYQHKDNQLRPLWDSAFSDDGSLLAISRSSGGFDILNAEVVLGIQQRLALRSLFLIFSIIFLLILLFATLLTLKFTEKRFRYLVKQIYISRNAYFLILPCFLLLIIFNYYPVIRGMVLSFSDWNASTTKIRWIGLDNFIMMFEEGYFFVGAKNLLIILITTYLKILTVPLIVAELIFNLTSDRAKYRYRILFLLPMIVPGMVGALLWKSGIFDPNFGVLNNLLSYFGFTEKINWLADERYALFAIILTGFPFVSIFHLLVYYGGLISIPKDLFEAAKVDGCNRFKSLFLIDLPMIAPQIKLLMILAFINIVQDFGAQYFLTEGGPGISTYVPGLELFYNATKFGRYGYASAMGLFMFIFILGATILQLRIKAKDPYS